MCRALRLDRLPLRVLSSGWLIRWDVSYLFSAEGGRDAKICVQVGVVKFFVINESRDIKNSNWFIFSQLRKKRGGEGGRFFGPGDPCRMDPASFRLAGCGIMICRDVQTWTPEYNGSTGAFRPGPSFSQPKRPGKINEKPVAKAILIEACMQGPEGPFSLRQSYQVLPEFLPSPSQVPKSAYGAPCL